MEERCTTLANLKPEIRNWFVKVMVIEKTPIRSLKWGKQQKVIFVDKENGTMQSIIYEQDVHELDGLIELYKTYYIGNAKIKEITGNTPILASLNHQMILSRSTYIKPVHEKHQLSIDDAYQMTPFAKCPEIADMINKQIS